VAVRLLSIEEQPPVHIIRKALGLLSDLTIHASEDTAREARYFRAVALYMLDEREQCWTQLGLLEHSDSRVVLLEEKLRQRERRDQLVGGLLVGMAAVVGALMAVVIIKKK
jgi:hypothetical protein